MSFLPTCQRRVRMPAVSLLVTGGLLALTACSAPSDPSRSPSMTPHHSATPQHGAPPRIGMANPASQFCIQQGGTLRMVHTPRGEQGLCTLPNGHEIEEWELFRRHHPQPR